MVYKNKFNRDSDSPKKFGRKPGKFGRSFDRSESRSEERSFSRRPRSSNREMFEVTCAKCGENCEVPFKPTQGKPVYCGECFRKSGGRSEAGGDRRSGFRRERRHESRSYAPRDAALSNDQLAEINRKLDKIIEALGMDEE